MIINLLTKTIEDTSNTVVSKDRQCHALPMINNTFWMGTDLIGLSLISPDQLLNGCAYFCLYTISDAIIMRYKIKKEVEVCKYLKLSHNLSQCLQQEHRSISRFTSFYRTNMMLFSPILQLDCAVYIQHIDHFNLVIDCLKKCNSGDYRYRAWISNYASRLSMLRNEYRFKRQVGDIMRSLEDLSRLHSDIPTRTSSKGKKDTGRGEYLSMIMQLYSLFNGYLLSFSSHHYINPTPHLPHTAFLKLVKALRSFYKESKESFILYLDSFLNQLMYLYKKAQYDLSATLRNYSSHLHRLHARDRQNNIIFLLEFSPIELIGSLVYDQQLYSIAKLISDKFDMNIYSVILSICDSKYLDTNVMYTASPSTTTLSTKPKLYHIRSKHTQHDSKPSSSSCYTDIQRDVRRMFPLRLEVVKYIAQHSLCLSCLLCILHAPRDRFETRFLKYAVINSYKYPALNNWIMIQAHRYHVLTTTVVSNNYNVVNPFWPKSLLHIQFEQFVNAFSQSHSNHLIKHLSLDEPLPCHPSYVYLFSSDDVSIHPKIRKDDMKSQKDIKTPQSAQSLYNSMRDNIKVGVEGINTDIYIDHPVLSTSCLMYINILQNLNSMNRNTQHFYRFVFTEHLVRDNTAFYHRLLDALFDTGDYHRAMMIADNTLPGGATDKMIVFSLFTFQQASILFKRKQISDQICQSHINPLMEKATLSSHAISMIHIQKNLSNDTKFNTSTMQYKHSELNEEENRSVGSDTSIWLGNEKDIHILLNDLNMSPDMMCMYLRRIKDNELSTRITLSYINTLRVEMALDMLHMMEQRLRYQISHPEKSGNSDSRTDTDRCERRNQTGELKLLLSHVEQKRQHIELYKDIINKKSMGDMSWTEIDVQSHTMLPNSIQKLLDRGEYEFAWRMITLFQDQYMRYVEKRGNTRTKSGRELGQLRLKINEKLFQMVMKRDNNRIEVIERLYDLPREEAESIIQRLIDETHDLNLKLLLIEFLLEQHFEKKQTKGGNDDENEHQKMTVDPSFLIKKRQLDYYAKMRLGVKIMLVLPSNIQSAFVDLVKTPKQFIEILLMAEYVDALRQLLSDHKALHDDQTVLLYFKRALDVRWDDKGQRGNEMKRRAQLKSFINQIDAPYIIVQDTELGTPLTESLKRETMLVNKKNGDDQSRTSLFVSPIINSPIFRTEQQPSRVTPSAIDTSIKSQRGQTLHQNIVLKGRWCINVFQFNQLRQLHFYPSAPDANLACALLDLVQDTILAAKEVLHVCKQLSCKGTQIRHRMVIVQLLKRLLCYIIGRIHRKNSNMLLPTEKTCIDDSYQLQHLLDKCMKLDARVGLFVRLYPRVVYLSELYQTEQTIKLRDRLINEGDLHTALLVSKQCMIPSDVVYFEWGKRLLQMGEYSGAREKLTICFDELMSLQRRQVHLNDGDTAVHRRIIEPSFTVKYALNVVLGIIERSSYTSKLDRLHVQYVNLLRRLRHIRQRSKLPSTNILKHFLDSSLSLCESDIDQNVQIHNDKAKDKETDTAQHSLIVPQSLHSYLPMLFYRSTDRYSYALSSFHKLSIHERQSVDLFLSWKRRQLMLHSSPLIYTHLFGARHKHPVIQSSSCNLSVSGVEKHVAMMHSLKNMRYALLMDLEDMDEHFTGNDMSRFIVVGYTDRLTEDRICSVCCI